MTTDGIKISALPAAASVNLSDIAPIVQSGATKETTFQLIRDLFANLFIQTTGSVTSGNLPVYGANGQTLKDCGVNVDTNKNLAPNNLLSGYTTTATAGATTTLTVASTYNQVFTGTSTQTVQLPVTSTLVLGHPFYIINNSTGVVTVTSSGGNTVLTLPANSTGYVTCILTSGTTAASWYADATGAGTDLFPNGTVVVTDSTQTIVNGTCYVADAAGIVTFALPGAVIGSFFSIVGINGWSLSVAAGQVVTIGRTTAIGSSSQFWNSGNNSDAVIFLCIGANSWQSVSVSGNPTRNDGTPALIMPTTTANSGVVVTSTSGVPSVLASPSDTRGHALLGRAAAGMSFSTSYYPNSGTLTGQHIAYDGTGYNNSTSTYADTYTINNLLFASGANTVTGLATANSSVLVTSAGGVPSLSTTLPSGLAATNLTLTTPALGTPSAGVLTSCTGLPISTGVSGLGTGVATALAANVNGSGAISLTTSPTFVTPLLGTPTSGDLSNCTNLPIGSTFSAGLNGQTTSSGTPVMNGFAVTNSVKGTHAVVTFCGQMLAVNAATNSQVAVRYGTGTAPVSGAAVTGTQAGTTSVLLATNTANTTIAFSKTTTITGLTPGTTYWFDMQIAQAGTGNTQLQNVDVSVISF